MIQLSSELTNGILQAEAHASDAVEYAFYIYRNDERIHTRPYAAERQLRWDTRLKPGSYRTKVFARNAEGKADSRYGTIHQIARPDIKLVQQGERLLVRTSDIPGEALGTLTAYRNGILVFTTELVGPPRAPIEVGTIDRAAGGIYYCEYSLADAAGEALTVRSRNVIVIPDTALASSGMAAWEPEYGPLALAGEHYTFPALFQPGAAGRLYVLLTGAVDRRRISLPKFARWSWADRFPGHVLALDDPTLALHDELELAWFIGTRQADATADLAPIVHTLAHRLGVPNEGIVFYGSSGGGFAALALAHKLHGSTAVAINPQVDATRFYPRQLNDLLRVGFDGITPEDAAATYPDRFCMQSRWNRETPSRVIIVQNTQDRHHYEKHYPLLATTLGLSLQTGYSSDRRHFGLLYSDPGGHGPEPEDLISSIIAMSRKFSRNESNDFDPADMPEILKEDFQIFDGGGSALPQDGFRPRVDVDAVPLVVPLDWTIDPFHDRNWRFHFQAWRFLAPVWKKYHGKDWKTLQQSILPYVLDWHRFHIAENQAATFAWYDMAVGLRAQQLAMLLLLQQQKKIDIPEASFAIVRELVDLHIAKLNEPGFISPGNHGIFQLQGLRLLELAHAGLIADSSRKSSADEQMRAMLHSQFDQWGIHTENSPSYHLFIMRTFKKMRMALFPAMAESHQLLMTMATDAAPWFTMPDGRIATIGDSSGPGVSFPKDKTFDNVVAARNGDPIVYNDLTKSGYAIVRTAPSVPLASASMLIVHGTAFSRVHAHADHLGFQLFSAGRKIFSDPGKYAYSRDAWRDYFVSDVAHNVVGLHDRIFGSSDTVTRGSALSDFYVSDAGTFVIDGRVARNGGFVHERRFIYKPGFSLALIDRVAKPAESKAVSRFQLAPDLQALAVGEREVHIKDGEHTLAVMRADTRRVTVGITRGQSEPLVGWTSPSYLQREPSTTIEWTFDPKVTEFTIDIILTVNES